ncbi:gas vesicle protein GvpO [Streptomyces xanthii]|uniref:Gas vesicle protein n=1 Tax=Streptomyces xanthii TaxID=2768069 RepID=A0A7H1B3G3_9ACTN|nr:gas vesicle protein [Streptomyces xanthii]QNS03268.1 gas vesicle protein [Streptomyces xanthii]
MTKSEKTPDTGAGAEPDPGEVLRAAQGQLAGLLGQEAESVSSFARSEDGWELDVEVLELPRVPDSTSLLASYRVSLGPDGMLTGYRRLRRYERGRAEPHPSAERP